MSLPQSPDFTEDYKAIKPGVDRIGVKMLAYGFLLMAFIAGTFIVLYMRNSKDGNQSYKERAERAEKSDQDDRAKIDRLEEEKRISDSINDAEYRKTIMSLNKRLSRDSINNKIINQ